MNNVERNFEESDSCVEYARRYFGYLSRVMAGADLQAIGRLAEIFEEARKKRKRIFFIGNGGSAATCSHFANDLGKGARVKGRAPFKAVSLADNVSLITAVANDEGYERVFEAQLEGVLEEGDVVVGISASGNSRNVLRAIEHAISCGAVTVGLTGFSGGRLKKIARHSVHIETPEGEYGPVEDFHMILDHLVTTYLKMAGEKSANR